MVRDDKFMRLSCELIIFASQCTLMKFTC